MRTEPSVELYRPDAEAVFVRRLHRFGAEVCLLPGAGPGGPLVTAHCPNPGRLGELLRPGVRVRLEAAKGPAAPGVTPGRRLAWTLAAVERADGLWVPLVSVRANRAAEALILPRLFPGQTLRFEVSPPGSTSSGSAPPGPASGRPAPAGRTSPKRPRFDALAVDAQGRRTWIEIKHCSLEHKGRALWPDAPSLRALHHLHELEARVLAGDKALLLFITAFPQAEALSPCHHTDPAFARALRDRRGVEARAFTLSEGPPGRYGSPREIPVVTAPLNDGTFGPGLLLAAWVGPQGTTLWLEDPVPGRPAEAWSPPGPRDAAPPGTALSLGRVFDLRVLAPRDRRASWLAAWPPLWGGPEAWTPARWGRRSGLICRAAADLPAQAAFWDLVLGNRISPAACYT